MVGWICTFAPPQIRILKKERICYLLTRDWAHQTNQCLRKWPPIIKLTYDGHSIMAAFFDYDRDGDLDLYILVNQKLDNVPTNYRTKSQMGLRPIMIGYSGMKVTERLPM